jgi:hypothetical protein
MTKLLTKISLKTVLLGLLIFFFILIMFSSKVEGFTIADVLEPGSYEPSYPEITPTSTVGTSYGFTLAPTGTPSSSVGPSSSVAPTETPSSSVAPTETPSSSVAPTGITPALAISMNQ